MAAAQSGGFPRQPKQGLHARVSRIHSFICTIDVARTSCVARALDASDAPNDSKEAANEDETNWEGKTEDFVDGEDAEAENENDCKHERASKCESVMEEKDRAEENGRDTEEGEKGQEEGKVEKEVYGEKEDGEGSTEEKKEKKDRNGKKKEEEEQGEQREHEEDVEGRKQGEHEEVDNAETTTKEQTEQKEARLADNFEALLSASDCCSESQAGWSRSRGSAQESSSTDLGELGRKSSSSISGGSHPGFDVRGSTPRSAAVKEAGALSLAATPLGEASSESQLSDSGTCDRQSGRAAQKPWLRQRLSTLRSYSSATVSPHRPANATDRTLHHAGAECAFQAQHPQCEPGA
mmetsp:Transcript_85468/g.238535  ORF Transcript_85468/g.238535 Transcript_85468/m.238535 type:complete len:351 (+) Transcript_85468:1-1053(+)